MERQSPSISRDPEYIVLKVLLLLASTGPITAQTNPFPAQQLLVADAHDVIRTDSVGGVRKYLMRQDNVGDMDFDHTTGFLYWINSEEKKIQRAYVMGENPDRVHVQDVLSEGLDWPAGLCGDWIRRQLYWTDPGARRIESMHVDGSGRRVLVSSDLDTPYGVTLDTDTNTLFWIDQGKSRRVGDGSIAWDYARIELLDLNSLRRRAVLENHLQHPTAVFFYNQRLFWSDDARQVIESCSVQRSCIWGINRDVRANSRYTDAANATLRAVDKPSSLTVAGGVIYWTEPNTRLVMMKNMVTSQIASAPNTGFIRPTRVHIYNSTLPTGIYPCNVNNGGCQQMCFESDGVSHCGCYIGYALNTSRVENTTCVDVNECQYRNSTSLCQGSAAVCINTPGSYRCSCEEGFALDDNNMCIDIDECRQHTHGCQQICTNTQGSYRCDCETGYALGDDGKMCNDVDECITTPGLCEHACVNVPGSYRCECGPGFMEGEGGSCDVITCSDDVPMIDGFLVTCGVVDGTGHICHIMCRTGRLIGDDIIRCNDQGEWVFPDVTCHVTEDTGPQLRLWPPGVAENIPAGATVGQLSLLDGNETLGVDAYSIVGDSSFSIQGQGTNWILVLQESLDHETDPEITLNVTVTVRRQTDIPTHLSLALTVEVYDVNEAPLAPSINETSVREDTRVGDIIGVLSSQDPDLGQHLRYYILNQVSAFGGPSIKFSTDGSSRLVLYERLDYETSPYYILVVKVKDNGHPQLSSTSIITIDIIDVNERPRGLNISNAVIEEYTGSSLSNTTSGSPIGIITVDDPDDPRKENYTLHILNVDWQSYVCFELKEIDRDASDLQRFTLFVGDVRCFDYETFQSQTAYIKVGDSTGRSFREPVAIEINNINEPPSRIVFSTHYVMEHWPIGMPLGMLYAVDPDSTPDKIKLSISSDGDLVRLDSGRTVVVNADYDYEVMQSFTFTARATDVDTGLFTEQVFTLTVRNQPNEPEIDVTVEEDFKCLQGDSADVCVPENLALGRHVAVVDVTLPGGGSSYIIRLDDKTGHFERRGNRIVLTKQLNYESGVRHISLTVMATDHNYLSSSKTLDISIHNTNDAPTEVLLSNTLLPEQVDVGYVVGELTCVDEDDSDSHSFRLLVASSNRFIIDDGKLKVNAELNGYEYVILVECRDEAGSTVTSHFVIEHAIGDGSNIVVTLSGDSVYENAPNGTPIGNITAHIVGKPSEIVMFDFKLENEANLAFSMKSLSNNRAEIYKNQSLDYETHPWHSVVVKVTDLIHSMGVKFANFTIKVLDVNEPPSGMWLSTQSIEEGPPDRQLAIVSLIDPEPGATYEFSLKQPEIHSSVQSLASKLQIVALENTRAQLTSLYEIDYESLGPWQEIVVIATDALVRTIVIEQRFNMSILNVNERPTGIWLQSGRSAKIKENVAENTLVDQIIVDDPDSQGDNSRSSIICDVIRDEYGWFVADRDLTLRVADGAGVDYERVVTGSGSALVNVTLQCVDEGGLYVTQSVTIEVQDVNEAPTGMDSTSGRESNLYENRPAGVLVAKFFAADPDLNDTATFTLSTSYDHVPFTFSNNSLYTTEMLNYEGRELWNLDITATDKGGLTLTRTFVLHVINVNDAPTDIILPQGVVVRDSWDSTTPVATIYIEDEDPFPIRVHNCVVLTQMPLQALAIVDNNRLQVNNSYVIQVHSYSSITVTIQCTDTGIPPLSINKTFRIPIESDSGDSAPYVSIEPNTIPEHFPNGTLVGVITVKDSRGLELSPGAYWIHQTINNSAESDTRALKVKWNAAFNIYQVFVLNSSKLSYESTKVVTLNLTVTVSTTASRTQYNTTLRIHLTDVMETPKKVVFYPTPSFPPGVSVSSVLKQGPYVGPLILNVKETPGMTRTERVLYYFYVVDEDIINNQELHYDVTITNRLPDDREKRNTVLRSASTDANFYVRQINASSWFQFIANATLDYESMPNYELYMVVKDTASTQEPLIQKLIIMLTDEREAPYNVTLSNNHLPENSPPGTLIGEIMIHDQDVSGSGYSITLSHTFFYIINNHLFLGYTSLNYEEGDSYTLSVNVSENNRAYRISKTYDIKIYVDDVAEAPCCLALYPGATTDVAIPKQSLRVNYSIGVIGVRDEDSADNDFSFLFNIVSVIASDVHAQSYFSIVNNNELVLAQVPDVLTLSSAIIYQLKIQTSDSSGLQYTGSLYVHFVDTCATCSLNAFCDMQSGQGVCTCKTGFTGNGVECTEFTPCSSMPCQNGGSCYHRDADSSYLCKCPWPYVGVHCESDTSLCDNVFCPYNGYCLPDSNIGYVCQCDEPYATDCSKCIANNRVIKNNCTSVAKAQSSEKEDRRLVTGVIAGLVALTLIFVIVLIVIYLIRRQKNKPLNRRVRYSSRDDGITVEPHSAEDPNQFENPLYSSARNSINYKYINQGTQHFVDLSKDTQTYNEADSTDAQPKAVPTEVPPPLTEMERTLSVQEEISI